jgi:tRNA pseudouridine38-40 synthase
MPRFFLELAYKGTDFCGYQRQPNGLSVQEKIETALETLLKTPTEIVGCGRTDAGVHAAQYFAHFDAPESWARPEVQYKVLLGLNALVGYDIAIRKLWPLHDEAHARFDATSRTYHYYLDLDKNPFGQQTATHIATAHRADFDLMQKAANILLAYQDFQTFCKSETDVKNYLCQLSHSAWRQEGRQWIYTVTANRFLRGMVRLIVGMCLQVGAGKISLDELHQALQTRAPLQKAYSAPPQGLFLTDIRYPFLISRIT